MMRKFDRLLEEEISGYHGKNEEIIRQAPALYRLMTRLLDDSAFPSHLSQLVIAAIAYFILPKDVIPEDEYGPLGFVDDLFLCAYVADKVQKEAGSDILIRNWDGEEAVIPLVAKILEREEELIGNKKKEILDCIGYEQLGEHS